ncbi:ATP-binding protein [Halogeometricum sp. S1BR25-6]|uniref:ATP-binding protein n=1 Tax=Halogeometricum salsisoli TaxID=2950536 RepID=A0ABU2GKM4_9EURY|nr:ATP-binding protein [Halogeometricum sp. S1BR25-6]MDS0300936.1 ATP-binding protein [Halogeometricum sp. S1BR25-6]
MSQTQLIQDTIADRCRTEHQELLDGLANKSAWSKEAELGAGNRMVASTHDNRTILELVQNARDAIREGPADCGAVSIIVGPESLLIANTGAPFRLHDEDVFEAVTSLGRSEKARKRGSIGEKGVGLKSVLQLSEAFSIRSTVDTDAGDGTTSVAAQFSRARTSRMLLGAYRQLLDSDTEFYDQLTEGKCSTKTVDACRDLLEDLPVKVADWDDEPVPPHVDVNGITRAAAAGKTPPSPLNVLGDLPRLSLFRYPFVAVDGAGQDTPTEQLAERLLQAEESSGTATAQLGKRLTDRLEQATGQYQTVVKLDYTDRDWSELLDAIGGRLDDIDSDAVAQFDDYRETPRVAELGTYQQDRQEEFWDECTALTPETLILLGQLERIDFLKVSRNGTDGQLELEEYRDVSIQPGETRSSGQESLIERQTVTVEEREGNTETSSTLRKEFRLYSRSLDPADLPDTDDDTSTEDKDDYYDVRILFERPRPADDQWAPTAKPLSLYYPIEEARTPFPFVVHAPFQVSFDRQRLESDDPLNHALLNELPGIVATAAEDLARARADSMAREEMANAYRPWLPWLLLPVADVAERTPEFLYKAIEQTLARLRETSLVPVDGGGVRNPTEVLLDPDRLTAFEALRNHEDDGEAPIPPKSVIANGQQWRDRAVEASILESDRFRTHAARIGLTTVIDQLFDDETGRGCIDILRELWGINPEDSTAAGVETDWAVSVEKERYAVAYFEAIKAALDRHGDTDDEGDDVGDAARQLGQWRVPLLPAEAHTGDGDVDVGGDSGQTTHLVRAASRARGKDAPQYQRSERIVFRRTEKRESGDRQVDRLPTPPTGLPVFIIPFDTHWDGLLKQHSRTWGTRELDSPTVFYRRVAAEAGGFSTDPEFDIEVLSYLVQLYRQITASSGSDWLVPEPYVQRRFNDVEKLVRSGSFGATPDDYETFVERRYTQRIPLPSADGRSQPAEELVFSSAWADRFFEAAEMLAADDHIEDPFEDEDEERIRPGQLRRWGHAIKCADVAVPTSRPRLAPPDDEQWDGLLDRVDVTKEEGGIWRLNCLIHLGVQIGPQIDWAWLFPGRGKQERRTGSISASEAQSLAAGEVSVEEDSPFEPPETLVQRYCEISWRAENHPAFTADHSTMCQRNWLDCNPATWAGGGSDVAILTWWYFTELDAIADPEQAAAYRDAIVLLWPELEDALLETAWVCDGHNLKEPDETIPALGLVQLREAALWPVEELGAEDDGADEFIDLDPERLHTATYLVTTADEQPRGAEQYLPRLDFAALKQNVELRLLESDGLPNALNLNAVAQGLGAIAVEELTTAAAAVRLDWFLDRRSTSGGAVDRPLRELQSAFTIRANSAPAYGLMRRLVSTTHLKRELSDQAPQQAWQRRDIWHTGTRVPITRNQNSFSLAIGAEASPVDRIDMRIYSKQLPQYARDQLEPTGVGIVERPRREAAEVANVLGRGTGEDLAVDFGIEKRTQVPELETVSGEHEDIVGNDAITDLRQTLQGKLEYLLAAYLASSQSPDLEDAYMKLSIAMKKDIGIVASDSTGAMRRRSAEWTPVESAATGGPRIAIFSDALAEHRDGANEGIPAYLAAEGLAQVIEQYDLREVFENILFKRREALDSEYQDELQTVEHEVTALRERRLDRVNRALTALVETVDPGAGLPDVDSPDIEAALRDLRTARSIVENDDDRHLLLDGWLTCLQDVGLSLGVAASCIEAAATDDEGTRQELLCTVAGGVSIDLDELVDSDPVWRIINDWQVSDAAAQLRDYLAAVVKLQTFWATLDDHEDGGEEAIELAISRARHEDAPPGPLSKTSSFIPYPERLPKAIQQRPLGALAYVDDGPIPTVLWTAVTDWCQKERTALVSSDVVFDDERIEKLLDGLVAAVAEPQHSGESVRKAFSDYTGGGIGTSRTRVKQRRQEQTTRWVSNEDEQLETISTTGLSAAGSPASNGSPSVGNTRGTGSDHQNAEIDDERGREGELICLGRIWQQFRSVSAEQRAQILDFIETWREAEAWRLQSVASIAGSLDSAALEDMSGAESLLDILRTPELADSFRERAAFHAIFDVSDERGPGFDLIDPFGAATVSGDSSEWTPEDMRRVEVKTIAADRAAKGRIKLTGNEFRMARRPGPGHHGAGDGTVYQYLVRIVALPTGWRENVAEATVWDIEDVISFAEFDSSDEPLWEKLRGGSFYVEFGTGD